MLFNLLLEVPSDQIVAENMSHNIYQCVQILTILFLVDLGAILYYVRIEGWVGGPENGNFPLLYVVKMSLRRWVGGSKKHQNTLT